MIALRCALAAVLAVALATTALAGGSGKNKSINSGYAADGKMKTNLGHYNKKHHHQNKH